MIRLRIVVEGQTEESFVNNVLAPTLWERNIYPEARLLGEPGHKGGRTTYARVKSDVLRLLKQDRGAYCSTMIDYYGLGPGFPGHPPPDHLPIEKVRHIESAVKRDICNDIPDLRADARFIPYLQLHEFEAILFSDPAGFAAGIHLPDLQTCFEDIRDNFPTPEDIDNDPQTAPSKRILAIYPRYSKVIEGTQAAAVIGIHAIREQCPHFREWIESLEALSQET